jgi:hypothetical protein
MAEQNAQTVVPTDRGVLVCRLRHRVGRWGPTPTAGEVELHNATGETVEIHFDRHPLQYFDLVVLDSGGATVSARPYGDIFSPLGKISTLRLPPGEKYTHNVSLLGNLPEEQRRPGDYSVRGVFDYNGMRAVSEPVAVHLPPERAKDPEARST